MSSSVMMLDAQIRKAEAVPFFVQRRVQFREATKQETVHSESWPSYKSGKHQTIPEEPLNQGMANRATIDANGFRRAERHLYPRERIAKMQQWERISSIGPGLGNLGNTCFMNAVLQCLSYTAPFANYLLAKGHGLKCRADGFCALCELECHVRLCLGDEDGGDGGRRQRTLAPKGFAINIKLLAKHFRLGRQEDSHEFLRYLIEAMQRASLQGVEKHLDSRIKETTALYQIFGGYLQSKVTCGSCGHRSCTYDPFLDLSLDVRTANTIERALKMFTTPETLAKTNRYRCESCKTLTEATKQFSIYSPPLILTIHLKRFLMTTSGSSKIHRPVEFAEQLDLAHYCTRESPDVHSISTKYDLYAVLVHEGHTTNSGHYHALVKASNGAWYSMNDSSVEQVGLATVLKQRAYILFYQRQLQTDSESETETEADVLATEMPTRLSMLQEMAKEAKAEVAMLGNAPSTPTQRLASAAVQAVDKEDQTMAAPNALTASMNLTDERLPSPLAMESVSPVVSNSMWHLSPSPLKAAKRGKPLNWTVSSAKYPLA